MEAEFFRKDKKWRVRDNEKVLLDLPLEEVTSEFIRDYAADMGKEFAEENEEEQLDWFEKEFESEYFGRYMLRNIKEVIEKLEPKEIDHQLVTSTLFQFGRVESAVLK